MADLVIGMAKSVVDGTLTKAQAAIEEEAKLRGSAQRNLVFITGEFQMMQSFLKVADGERLGNIVVRTWVRQIRDLAFDVEDCIEFVVHLDKRNRWWLRLLHPGSWFMPCLGPLQLDEAVAELERLKTRVEYVSARNSRYSLISDSGNKPAAVEHQPASGDALGSLVVATGTRKASLTYLLLPKEGSGHLRVISVWGSGGGDLGMTSVVWDAYTAKETSESFACRAWVKLRRPFNQDEFIRSLMAQFLANTCQEQAGAIRALDVQKEMKAKQDDLLAEFAKQVNEKRFLIVLEDLSTMEEWNAITTFFPKQENNGSCIIVSTLHFEVASLSVGHPYHILHLNQLPAQGSVYAFHKMDGPVTSNNSCKKEAAKKFMEKQPLFGRLSELKALDQHVVVSAVRSNQIISVWGATGVGKSALLKYLFCDKILNSRLYTKYAWVDLSYPFNLEDFSRSLLLSLDSEDIQTKVIPEDGVLGSENHVLECHEMLRKNGCLIVINGLQSTKEWDMIQARLVRGSNATTTIIVISSEESIATNCLGGPINRKQPLKYEVCQMGPSGTEPCDPAASYTLKKEAAMIWMATNPLVGRESEIKELGYLRVVNATKFKQALSVWGVAGVGKSALVKHLFCDKILNGKLYKKYAWVDLSHPFSLWDFCRSILFSFESQDIETNVSADHGAMGSKNPIAECREMLRDTRQRCLVVIDGLQSTKEWDLIQDELLSGSGRAWTFIVIASEESIATHCSGSSNPLLKYNVKCLEHEAAFRLFNEVSEKKRLRDDDKAVLQGLVTKCGGLPKVIVEIGNLMKSKTVGWMERATSINNKFMQELKSSKDFGGLQGLFYWIQSYFRNCPDFLKPCIFYLSIFSPETPIRRRRLVRRWIAEGYTRDGHEESAEENGEKQFFNLLSLSIIQQPSSVELGDTKLISCQVNGFFREYIISQRLEENLVFELDGSCTVSTQRTGRHLAISESWDRDDITVFKSIDFSKLRSLTVSGKWESFFVSEGMMLLRVLDLEDVTEGVVKYSDIKKIVKCFPRLKFLSLRGRSEIRLLPSSVGDLRQLQTLDIRHTSVVTLPVNITKLQSLQYIRAGTTTAADQPEPSRPHLSLSRLSDCCKCRNLVGIKMPTGIGKLPALHTLGVVNVSASGTKAILEDLKKLRQLRKLGVSGINMKNSKKFLSTISVLVHLESLSVQLDKDSKGCLDLEGILLPLEKLRSLKLHGLGDKLPAWSQKLNKITKIDLEMDKIVKQREQDENLEHAIMFLGMLPELCILRVCARVFEDDELIVMVTKNDRELDSYKKVKILQIACSSGSNLQVTFGLNTMKNLEQLKVVCSSATEYMFDGLRNLPEIKEVCLKGPNANMQRDHVQSLLNDHPNSPVLKVE